ncbi:TPA: DUF2806 domain-containing protein [Klebsiella pneumoniae]
MDPQINVNADFTPAIEGGTKGLGKLFRVILGKRLSNSDYHEALSNAQKLKDVSLIEGGVAEYRDGALIILRNDAQEPNTVAGAMLSMRDANAREALNHAIHTLQNENPVVDEEPLSETFFHHWYNHASKVSEDEVRSLWGRVLASEIQAGGSISLRTMNILSTMEKRQLQSLEILSKYTAGGKLIFSENNDDIRSFASDVSVDDINEMMDLGIVRPEAVSNFIITDLFLFNKDFNLNTHTWGANEEYILGVDKRRVVSVKIKNLTSTGSLLLRIAQSNIDLDKQVKDYCLYLLHSSQLSAQNVVKIDIFKRTKNGTYQHLGKVEK